MRNRAVSIWIPCIWILISGCIFASQGLASTITVATGSDAVTNGNNFQNAINSANFGDTIILTAGAVYQGNFTLPDKGMPPAGVYVTIRTSAISSLPLELVNRNTASSFASA